MSEVQVDKIKPSISSKVSITPQLAVQDSTRVDQFSVHEDGQVDFLGPVRVGEYTKSDYGQIKEVLSSQGDNLPPYWGLPKVDYGAIIMWYGNISAIPAGWALCDGRTVYGYKTPDLRNRFLVGAGSSYYPNNTGGNTSITHNIRLQSANLHPHRHRMTIAAPDDSNGLAGYNTNIQYLGNPHELEQKGPPRGTRTGYFHIDTGVGVSTDGTQHSGSPISLTVDVVPPFYALCFIMQVPTSSTT